MEDQEDNQIGSNLEVRSNLYVREEDKNLTVLGPVDISFLRHVRGLEAIKTLSHLRDHMTDFQRHYLDALYCSICEAKETTLGPVARDSDGTTVYGCRCAQRDDCLKKRREGKRCEKCSYFRG